MDTGPVHAVAAARPSASWLRCIPYPVTLAGRGTGFIGELDDFRECLDRDELHIRALALAEQEVPRAGQDRMDRDVEHGLLAAEQRLELFQSARSSVAEKTYFRIALSRPAHGWVRPGQIFAKAS